MSRITGNDAKSLMEAYGTLYSSQELTEENVWEEVEKWVNSLLDEGHDLSEYTWEEMYIFYLNEASGDVEAAGGDFGRWLKKKGKESLNLSKDVLGAQYQGWMGKTTTSKNPVTQAVNLGARITTTPLRDYAIPFVKGMVSNTPSASPKPEPKPAAAKPAPTKPKPQQKDSGREAGEYLAPSLGSPKAADPLVRSGGSYGFFGAIKPATAKPATAKPATAKPAPAAAKPAPKPTNTGVKKDPRGAVIVNHFENENDSLVTEAPAQVAPITGTGGKGWYQKNQQGKYVPITDPELAKQAAARWKAEKNKPAKPAPKPQPEPTKPAKPEPAAAKPEPSSSSSFTWNPNKNIIAAKGGKLGIMDKGDPKSWREPSYQEKGEIPISSTNAFRNSPAGQAFLKQKEASKGTSSTSSASASTADKIKGGSEVYKQQIKTGNIKGAEKTGMDVWRAKYADTLAKKVTPSGTQKGTGQSVMAKQAAELRSLRPATAKPAPGNEKPGYSGPPTPTAPQAQSKLSGGAYSPDATKLMSQRSKNILGVKEGYDAFDLVMEYLLSQGHVGTLDEALYVMMEMDSKCIQSIVENVSNEPKLKPGSGLGGGKPTYEKGKEPKPTGAKLPTLPSA